MVPLRRKVWDVTGNANADADGNGNVDVHSGHMIGGTELVKDGSCGTEWNDSIEETKGKRAGCIPLWVFCRFRPEVTS